MAHSKRKQNFVDNQVQGALLRRIAWHWVTFFCVSGTAIILLQALLGDPDIAVLERLKLEAGEFFFLGIVMAALFPAFMLDTIRFSNRFVGPVSRFRRHLRQLAAGDTATCAFRGSDFWSGMADEFNKVAHLVDRQNEEIERLKKRVGEPATEASESTLQEG